MAERHRSEPPNNNREEIAVFVDCSAYWKPVESCGKDTNANHITCLANFMQKVYELSKRLLTIFKY